MAAFSWHFACCCGTPCIACKTTCTSCRVPLFWTVTGSPTGGPCAGGLNVTAESHTIPAPESNCDMDASVKWIEFRCYAAGTSISRSSGGPATLAKASWVITGASSLIIFYKEVTAGDKRCCWYEGAYDIFWQEPACGAGTPVGTLAR